MKMFLVDDGIRIDYSVDINEFYIHLQGDKIFPAVLPEVENLSLDPIINVKRIGDAVVGIEIVVGNG